MANPIAVFSEGNRVVRVYWNSNWEEFRCVLNINNKTVKDATYFTNDKQDALDTAKIMVRDC